MGDDLATQILIGAIFDHGKPDSVFNGAIDEAGVDPSDFFCWPN